MSYYSITINIITKFVDMVADNLCPQPFEKIWAKLRIHPSPSE